MNLNTYMFEIDVDGGAEFHHIKEMIECGTTLEIAKDKIFDRLHKEYRDKVAFFEITFIKRI